MVCELRLEVGKRWWFGAGRAALILLAHVGLIRDTRRAAIWLACKGLRVTVVPARQS